MNPLQAVAVEEALRSELGKLAKFAPYGREHRTPMTFVLDEVERQIGTDFLVYWVDDGPPELFCLPGFSPSPVVFSTRYLSVTAFIRHLLVDEFLKGILVEVTQQTALKLMAEMALRKGDPDYAVMAFLKSIVSQGAWLSDYDDFTTLEYEPINEAYMATWFYGLVHEIGHTRPHQDRYSDDQLFSDAQMLELLQLALQNFPVYPEPVKGEALQIAQQHRSDSVIGTDQVRSEGLADIFAASVLLRCTFDVMREIHQLDSSQKEFEMSQYISEMIIFLNIIGVVERCRQVASIASAANPSREAAFDGLLHPVSLHMRGLMMRTYLDTAVTTFFFGDNPTADQHQQVVQLNNSINDHFVNTINKVDTGMSRAMEFSLFPDRREDRTTLLEAFRKNLLQPGLTLTEARKFCQRADALGADGELLRTVKEIVSRS